MARTLVSMSFVVGTSVAWAAGGTPSEAYLAYHAAALQAKKVADFAAFLSKSNRDTVDKLPLMLQANILKLHQDPAKMATTTPKVVKETIVGDKATLELASVCDFNASVPPHGRKNCSATVTMVKEPDGWKLATFPNWQEP